MIKFLIKEWKKSKLTAIDIMFIFIIIISMINSAATITILEYIGKILEKVN